MKSILLALGLLLLGNFATAGVYIETATRNIKTQKSDGPLQKIFVQDGVGRMENGEGNISIVKGEAMYVLDTKRKTYMVFDKASTAAMAKSLNDAMAKMQSQLAKMSPEQRAQMEKMMGGAMPGAPRAASKLTSADTGRADKVGGRTCRIWQIKRDGVLEDELCVVPYSSLPGKEDIAAVFEKVSKMFEGMSSSMPGSSNEYDAYARVKGYPVRIRGYSKGKMESSETVLNAWREERMAPSLFVIPAGYKKEPLPSMTPR